MGDANYLEYNPKPYFHNRKAIGVWYKGSPSFEGVLVVSYPVPYRVPEPPLTIAVVFLCPGDLLGQQVPRILLEFNA
jgi:hypothetical protein